MVIGRLVLPVCLAASLGLVATAGCGVLHTMHSDHGGGRGAPPSAPQTTVSPPTLTEAPDGDALLAHYCPILAMAEPLGAPASAACRAHGPAPDVEGFRFRARFEATARSSNPVRLAVESVLLVLTTYPESGAGQTIGAVCLTLCDEGDSTCPQTPEACRSADEGVLDLADVEAVDGFVTSVAVDESHVADLAVRSLPAHGQASLSFDLALASETLLDAIRENDADAMRAIRAGQTPTFTIPYAIEGTFWVEGRGNDGFPEPIPRTLGAWTVSAR